MKFKQKAKAQLLKWLGLELEYKNGELWNIYIDGEQIPSGANSFAGDMKRLRQIESIEKRLLLLYFLHGIELAGLTYFMSLKKQIKAKQHSKYRQPF